MKKKFFSSKGQYTLEYIILVTIVVLVAIALWRRGGFLYNSFFRTLVIGTDGVVNMVKKFKATGDTTQVIYQYAE